MRLQLSKSLQNWSKTTLNVGLKEEKPTRQQYLFNVMELT